MTRQTAPGTRGNGAGAGHDTRTSMPRIAARMCVVFGVVMLLLALALRGLDRVPGMIAGLARGATRVASLEGLERILGFAVPIPAFFPSGLAWPPADIEVFPGPSAVVTINSRETGAPALLIGTAARGIRAVSPALLAPVSVLQASESTFGARRVTVARVQDASGAVWHQAVWSNRGRVIVVRYRGDLHDLSRMVEGMAR